MAKRRYYRNPPLVEALCQFQFQPGREWDNTVPGLLYAQIRDEYPVRRQRKAIEIVLNESLSDLTRNVAEKTQFVRSDDSAMVQVGTDILVINMLRPYKGWEQFRERVLAALKSYTEVAEPVGFRSLALRYINRIMPPTGMEMVQNEDYLKFSPTIPGDLPDTLGRWTQSVDIILPEAVLRLTSGSSYKDENLSFVLDIEMVRLELNAGQVEEYLEQFHSRIEQAFEECITPTARALFEEEDMPHERVG